MADDSYGEKLTDRLRAVAQACGVPGASVAVFRDGQLYQAAFGVLSTETGEMVTPGSLFHVGSVTKPFVAVAIMALVDAGMVDLEAPVARYLPELALAGAAVSPRMLVRHLLAHSSGIDGDFFIDTGAEDDCIAKYIARCAEVPLVCEPGEAYAYCNAGYVILAGIAERVAGQVWDDILRERVLAPLGATDAFTLARDQEGRSRATGHMEAEGKIVPVPSHVLPRALGPAGSLMSTPSTLVALGRMLLDKGVEVTGARRVLSEAALATMLSPAIDLPDGTQWALGWKREYWNGELVISHDGGVSGQAGNLWIVPRHRVIYAQCANGGRSAELHRTLMGEIFAAAGVHETPVAEPEGVTDMDMAPYEGRFENIGITIDFTRCDGGLKLHGVQKQFASPPVELVLKPLDREKFVTRMGGSSPIIMSFSRFDEFGVPQLFYAGRLHKRTGLS